MNDPKSKRKCFHYGGAGHWKMNCPNYLAQKKNLGIIESLIIKVSFIEGTSNFWCVDSGTTNHICNTLQGFLKTRKPSDGKVTLHLSLEVRVAAMSIGVVELFFFSNKILVLNYCLFIP